MFQQAEPLLLSIEERYNRLVEFEKAHDRTLHSHITKDQLNQARESLLESIRGEMDKVEGKIYYWLYPFYSGDFLQLVAALGSAGAMEKQKDDEESRNAFYRFFKTVPLQERLGLGKKLNNPELTEQAERIQSKIQAKKKNIRHFLNKHHAN